MMTPSQHEKSEWSRMASAAYAASRNDIGTRYSVAASIPYRAELPLEMFDSLQAGYRAWLIDGTFPEVR
jgi:hypothetical protein